MDKIECHLVKESDLELLMEWRMRPDITKNMRTHPVLTMKKQKEWFTKICKEDSQYHWVICISDIPIGVINIQNVNWEKKNCSIGIYIAQKGGGPGLFYELHWNLFDLLFETLDFQEIYAETLDFNKTAVMLNKRLWPEITKQEDCYEYRITKKQWEKIKETKHYQKILYEWKK